MNLFGILGILVVVAGNYGPDRYWFFAIVGLLAMAGWPVGKKHCGSIWSWWQTVALWLRKLCDSGLMNGL